ncbi:hypothetical protein ACJRO7_021476 [Eucalyptus globulus]|uniref:Uncharacterized protein n=1 Tax=Eucalyptus globulus TaxID=34317 RepID=A0ABD3KWN1_EUCGL
MAILRSGNIHNGGVSRRISSRPIPKRGQVMVGIVVGLAHSFAYIFSPHLKKQICSVFSVTEHSLCFFF